MATKVKDKKVKQAIVIVPVEKVKEEVIPERYVVNIVNVKEPYAKDERVAQITWISAGNKLVLAIQDTRFSSDLEQLVEGNIVTAEGRTYNPISQPKEWILNLSKVAPNNLWNRLGASEARALYEN